MVENLIKNNLIKKRKWGSQKLFASLNAKMECYCNHSNRSPFEFAFLDITYRYLSSTSSDLNLVIPIFYFITYYIHPRSLIPHSTE